MHIWGVILLAWAFWFEGFSGYGDRQILVIERIGYFQSKSICDNYRKSMKLGSEKDTALECFEMAAMPVIDETPRTTLVDPALPRTQAELNDLLMQQPVPQQ